MWVVSAIMRKHRVLCDFIEMAPSQIHLKGRELN